MDEFEKITLKFEGGLASQGKLHFYEFGRSHMHLHALYRPSNTSDGPVRLPQVSDAGPISILLLKVLNVAHF